MEEVYRYAFELLEMGSTRLFVSIDECSFSEKVIPLYGYSAIGVKCEIRGKKGSWKNQSLVLALASDGTKHYAIQPGAFTRSAFGKFVESMPYPPGTVLILDNVPSTRTWIVCTDQKVTNRYTYHHMPPNSSRSSSPFQKSRDGSDRLGHGLQVFVMRSKEASLRSNRTTIRHTFDMPGLV